MVGPQFEADIVEGDEMYTFSELVKDRLQETGVIPTTRPIISEEHAEIFPGTFTAGDYFDGRLPGVIRKLTVDQLSDIHVLFTSWFSYVQFQETLVDIQRSEAERRKEFVEAKLKTIYASTNDIHTQKKRSDQQVRDATKIDKRYIEVNAFYLQMKGLQACLAAAVKTAAEDLKTISREVTRAKMKQDNEIAKQYMSGRPSSRFERGEPAIEGSTEGFQRRYKRGRADGE